MLEVLAYLRANGFKTFVVSGGGIEFMRSGPTASTASRRNKSLAAASRSSTICATANPCWSVCRRSTSSTTGPGKPVGIHQHIGRRPLMAFGNSDGDFEMLQYTTASEGPRFGAHRPSHRRRARVGLRPRLGRGPVGKAVDAAPKEGWLLMNMKKDWKVIYPPQR